ncbi:hypothetical protein MOQ_007480, partial [Trypanosoma cruzi marinkellei]
MASLRQLSRLERAGCLLCKWGGDGCGFLLLLVVGGSSVVVCFLCVDAVLRCVQCASFPCRGRSHHYRPRNGDAATMCVCVCVCLFLLYLRFYFSFVFFLLFTLCAGLLTDFSTSTTAAADDDDDDDDGGDEGMVRVGTEVLCGSKDSGGHWRLVGESNWTACRADKNPDSQDLTDEEASNAIFCDFVARSCSDYDGTNNSGGTEEHMNPALMTPNAADVYSDRTVSTVLEHPPPTAKKPTSSSACSSATQSTSPLNKKIKESRGSL